MVSVPGHLGVGFVSTATDHDVMVVGPASLDLRLSSSARDTDLQATLSEVRPDGRETAVTTGHLRASFSGMSHCRRQCLEPQRDWLNPRPLAAGIPGRGSP